MKNLLIYTFCALALLACNGGQKQNNGGNNSESAVEYTASDALPEMVFDELKIEKIATVDENIPSAIFETEKIVIKGDRITFYSGAKELSAQIDLKGSREDVGSDLAYFWFFYTKANNQMPELTVNLVSSVRVEKLEQFVLESGKMANVYEYPVIYLIIDGAGHFIPKNADRWKNVRRKLLANHPTDDDYEQNYDRMRAYYLGDEEDEDSEPQGLAYDILKQMSQTDNSPVTADDFQNINWRGNEDSQQLSFSVSEGECSMYCFPHDDGGYMVMLQYAPHGDDCQPNTYTTWLYQNYILTKTDTKNTLPCPTIDDFYYDIYTQYPADAVAVLKEKIANNLQYEYKKGDKVKVKFYTADNSKALEETGRTSDGGFPSIIYKWDGRQFVQNDIAAKLNGFAINIIKAISEQRPDIFDKMDLRELTQDIDDSNSEILKYWNGDKIEEPIGMTSLPIKTGGHYILFCTSVYDENSKNYTLLYKDGNITEIPKSQLYPQPTINDFYANADQFPKEIYDLLVKEIETHLDYLYNENNNWLNVMWLGNRDEEILPEPLQKLKKDGFQFPLLLYSWDGEHFVIDPDNKPLKYNWDGDKFIKQ